LAWEAAADDIRGNSIGSKPCGGEGSHVVVAGDAGKVLGEDVSTEGLDLAERDGSHSGPLEPEAETADPAEKIEDIQADPL